MTVVPWEPDLIPIYQGSRLRGIIRWFFSRFTPFDELVEIRGGFLDAFRRLYHSYPAVEQSLSHWDNPTLVQNAGKARDNARHYNPHKGVESVLGIFTDLQKVILAVLGVLTLLSYVLGLALYPVFQELFSTTLAPFSFLPTVIFIALWLYLGFLRWNRDALQVFNEHMTVTKSEIHRKSRKRPELVSYYIWNEVLQGQTIPSLVCLFYLLDQMASLPVLRRYLDQPSEYLLNEITDNYDLLIDRDGYLSATWDLYQRKRKQSK